MTTIKLDFKINDREILRGMRQLQRAGGDMRRVFQDIGEGMLLNIEDRFNHQVDPDGRPWVDLHPQTRAKKKHPKILTESQDLRRSYIYRASDARLEVGSNDWKAAIHQFGKRTRPHVIRPKNKKALFWAGASHPARAVQHPGSDIPARRMIGLGATDRALILDKLQAHYARALHR